MEKIVICNAKFEYYPEMAAAILLVVFPKAELLTSSTEDVSLLQKEFILLGQTEGVASKKEATEVWDKHGDVFVHIVDGASPYGGWLTFSQIKRVRETLLYSFSNAEPLVWIGGASKEEYTLENVKREVLNLQKYLKEQVSSQIKLIK